ncbi:MAG: hypothetical protein EOO54_22065 [Haliea sp.]|nr:MAG: hypothetical protein EOO54_22065 [Haliea sp.]
MDTFAGLMLLPVAASLCCLLWLALTGSRRALQVTLAVSLLGLLQWGWISWEFRDGILFGPRTSHGWLALQRFGVRFWMPLAAWAVFFTVTLFTFNRWRRSRRPVYPD